MISEQRDVIVLGLGNVLCTDDGAGVAALHQFRRGYDAPGVQCLDGGTLGLSLLPQLEGAEQLFLLDAVLADAPPGTLVRLEGDEVGPAVYARLSPHQIGVSDLLDGARLLGRYPTRVVLLGVVPASIALGIERTAAVRAALPDLVRLLVDELVAIGCRPVPRQRQDPALERGCRDGDRALGL